MATWRLTGLPCFLAACLGWSLASAMFFENTTALAQATTANWSAVGGDPGGMRYSALKQIQVENVSQLEVAWTYHTGELVNGKGKTIECTPLIVDGKMYVTTAERRVIALNAATGEELWKFDPAEYGPLAGPLASGGVNRGLAYWSDPTDPLGGCLFHGTADGRLYAIEPTTGKLRESFGTRGAKDLREDLEGDLSRLPYGPTSAPAVFGDLVILGFSNGEGPDIAAPGDIRAFDARTGQQRWRFHTVPRPGERGHETWEEGSWQNRGGANAWGGLSIDVERGWVFAGLGSAAFDFYGGDRKGDNLFGNCVLALDATTGEYRWHFQTIKHDLWDHDLPVYPNLITLTGPQGKRSAVAQVTKTGFVFVLDRDTGESLFPIEQRPVMPSTIPGEVAAATQPFPQAPPPFATQHFDESNVTNIGETNRRVVLDKLLPLRRGPAFQPPSLEGTIVIPGFHGGANWSGACFDPISNLLYVNATNEPNVMQLEKAPEGSRYAYQHKGYQKLVDQEGYPGIEPPWGELFAIDLQTGKHAWHVPLGEFAELTARGIPITGTPNFGGPIVTAGGLVFIAGTKDECIRAFDKTNGKVLWKAPLPAGGYANPATYAVNEQQYVVIAAGGAGKLGTKAGDAFVCFRLPLPK